MHEKPKPDFESRPTPSPGLLPTSTPPPPPKPGPTFTQKWNESIDPIYADYIGLLLCFVTGLCDSSAYNAWTCFLAMQTGTSPPCPCIQIRMHTPYTYTTPVQKQKHNANTRWLRQYNLPRPRGLLPALQQTMGLAQISNLHNLLLYRRLHLQQHHASRGPATPRHSLPLVPRSSPPHHNIRGIITSKPHPARHRPNRIPNRRSTLPRTHPHRPTSLPIRRLDHRDEGAGVQRDSLRRPDKCVFRPRE